MTSLFHKLANSKSIKKGYQKAMRKRPANWTIVDDFGVLLELIYKENKQDLLRAVSEATDNYHDGNIIKDMGSGKVLYKGKFSWDEHSMDIAVWRFDRQYRENYVQFRSEIETLTTFKHDNISSICELVNKDENDNDQEHLIIYKHAIHGNLQGHLKDPALTWSRRLQICLGVARAMNYIHNEHYIHCDINSSKILLADDWEPKIFGFELCTKYSVWKSRLHLRSSLDTTREMTQKYDVYLYGELLFEVLCGTKPKFDKGGFNGKLDDNIDPSLRKHLGSQSMKLFKNVAKNCLEKEFVERRPRMDQIVKELEETLELEKLLECSTNEDEGASSNRWLMERLEIPLIEIMSATNNFDNGCMVGHGGSSKVYRADLDVLDIQSVSSIIKGEHKDDEQVRKIKTDVAIKRLSVRGNEKLAKQGFLNEIKLLVRCDHPNVVSLRGFCVEANEMILVCEFAKKESLGQYLRRGFTLNWAQRLQICLDVAQGINYLHTNVEGKARIIHRDIKSDNILLDENLNAKVSDLGLSRFHYPTVEGNSSILTNHHAGTKPYMDPEYRTTYTYRKESDIYSFGVVLFEVLAGKRADDQTYLKEHDDGLAPFVRERFEVERMKDLIDLKMTEEDDEHTFTLNRGPTEESLEVFSNIGRECLSKTRAKRPKMEDVIERLNKALDVQFLQGETMVLTRFRLSSIEDAIQKLANENYVGFDSYGKVYKVQLDPYKSIGNQPKKRISVAIKHITGREHERGESRFESEIEIHAKYKHVNIVPLLGFCSENGCMFLVYENANASLDDYLRDTDNTTKYTWIQRLNLCLKIAHGLDHLHTLMDRKKEMIHTDIRSANILLGKSGDEEAKIAYFGFSKLLPPNQQASTNTVRTNVYCCPEYQKTGEPNKQSDIYSFGVVLFEIFCGRVAYDRDYTDQNGKGGLAPVARRCFNDGTIKKMIDPTLKEETSEEILTSNREPMLDSLDTYLRIANQCLAENPAERPTMQQVIEELEKALDIQENFIKGFQISFKDVQSATGNFSQKNCFGSGRYWKVYKGELRHSNANLDSANGGGGTSANVDHSAGLIVGTGPTMSADPTASDADANTKTDLIVAKRWHSKTSQGDRQFRTELSIIIRRKHKNIIGLVGYCDEMDERIVAYEQASKGSLDMYLNDATLTWMKRIEICRDVARALKFLHGGDEMLKKVVHGNIQSPGILLNDDWKAKLSNLEMSSLDSLQQDTEHVSNNTYGALGYLNPEYEQGYLTEKSDIYSFGVVMFEILCGRLAWSEGIKDHFESLGPLAKMHHKERKLNEMVFEGIKEEIGPDSMAKYADIASQCLHNIREERPTAARVVSQLKNVLKLQKDYEGWLAKLRDYREIVQMAFPKIDATIKGKDLYNMLCKGIAFDEGKRWFSLGSNEDKNILMIASSQFSYENHHSLEWRSDQESRFHEIAKISDISNLKINIKIRTQYLSANINYGVYLVFRLCAAKKADEDKYVNLTYKMGDETLNAKKADKDKYVNLTYKMGDETLNAYFATWRKDNWMGIELYRFLNDKEDTDFEFLLESFSQRYCGSGGIYVEGIEFRAISKEKHKENDNSSSNDSTQSWTDSAYNLITWPFSKLLSGKDSYMLPSSVAIDDSSNAELFDLKPESRFGEVIEVRSTQEFRIKCKIESISLPPNKEYMCYLVFKLSEECSGLHCPVIIVRDLLQGKGKKTGILYFRTPRPWNINDVNQCPKKREDGWLEVNVWKIKSSDEPQSSDHHNSIKLKLQTYEGTMSGLVICGLEFRPM